MDKKLTEKEIALQYIRKDFLKKVKDVPGIKDIEKDEEDDLYIEGDWEQELNESYEEGKKHLDDLPPIVRIEHLTGFAKTARVKAWLKHFKVNHVYIAGTLRRASSIEVEVEEYKNIKDGVHIVSGNELKDILTPTIVKKNLDVVFTSEEIDKMNEKDMVIVIDDYDWASLNVRKEFLNLLRFSKVTDLREKDNNYFKELKDIAMIVLVTHPDTSPFSEPYTEIENQLLGKKEY